MSMNENWPRWIFASVSKHFYDRRQGLDFFIEGQHRATRGEKDFLELRMDGPQITEISKNCYTLYGEVNILITSIMDNTNYHRIHTHAGIVAAAFTMIPLIKYGTGTDDDGTQWGCWNLIQNPFKRQRVDIFHFGQVDVRSEVVQATVEGHYKTIIKT